MEKQEKRKKIAILILRIAFGVFFLYAGLDKILNNFSAENFLNNSIGPFSSIYKSMAGSPVVDYLVMSGEALIGLSLLLGVALRFACSSGVLMMLLYYCAVIPPKHGPVNENIMYAMIFVVLATFGAGRYYGLDSFVENLSFVKSKSYLKFLLG